MAKKQSAKPIVRIVNAEIIANGKPTGKYARLKLALSVSL
jgi:hypothetical protein